MVKALIAFGGNQATEEVSLRENLERAIFEISAAGLEIDRVSRWYQTPAYPKGKGDDFLNGVLRVASDRAPDEILQILSKIETQLGRVRKQRWGPRLVDLDLLDVDMCVIPDPE